MNTRTVIASLSRRLQQARRIAADRHLLAQMNAHQLRDIGLESGSNTFARTRRMGSPEWSGRGPVPIMGA